MREKLLLSALFITAFALAAAGVGAIQVYEVQTGSMEPGIQPGDEVYAISYEGHYSTIQRDISPQAAHETTAFGGDGDVIVFYRNGNEHRVVVIHRAVMWVDAGENWYDRADPALIRADSCDTLNHCPAPHAGYITHGDANSQYDQASGLTSPIKPEWIVARAIRKKGE